ncbi:MAG: multicopper oxidase domain-containing protein [Candidatus Methanoperedens sp.]|nr:multicopper oxidase domain-containing protein [Candidatus Methanoperedens sp.]
MLENKDIKKEILRMNRRTFVKLAGTAVGALALGRFGFPTADAAQSLQVPLAGSAIPQFIDPLPTLSVAGGTMNTVMGNQPLALTMREFDANILPTGTFAPGIKPTTKVWGYTTAPPAGPLDTYIGPVIIADRSTAINPKPPTALTMTNALGSASTTNVLAYKYSTDQTLHWADPLNNEANTCSMGGIPAYLSPCAQNYAGPVPAVVHLHGGEVPPVIDGGPDAWFTSDGTVHGHGYYSEPGAAGNQAIYKYPNTQEASPIWFHDHTLGATRLNVYAGLAGAYVINDPAYPWYSSSLAGPVVPIVLQDRMFDTTGQLFFPGDTAGGLLWTTNPDHPYWVPEFVGDTIVVNGKAWPFFNVAPQRYRFLFLNGSNARTYELFLQNQTAGGTPGPVFWQIGTDGGYLDKPVKVDPNDPVMPMKLTLMPGERADVIIDFTGIAPGTILLMRNTGRTPYPKGKSPQGSTTGRIMQFKVVAAPVPPYTPGTFDPTVATATLRSGTGGQSPPIVRFVNPATGTKLVTPANVRQLTLNEVLKPASTATDPVTGLTTAYPGGPLEILVNNTKYEGLSSDMTTFPGGVRPDFTPLTIGGKVTYYSEVPKEGDTEMWEIINLTADAHPIHLHLVQFQLVNRQNFNKNNYIGAYAAAFPVPAGGVAAFIPAFGPPLHYTNGTTFAATPVKLTTFLGGNPDVMPFLQGAVMPPATNEAGWKDTIMALPGQVTRIMVRFAPTDLPTTTPANQLYYPFNPDGGHGYVWHCHIIDHEDNEMMRPYIVRALATPAPVASITGPTSGTLNTPVNLTANVTWAQGLTGTVAWSAPGGTPATGTGSTFAVAFAVAGTYTIIATATDSRGNTSTATTTITIA